MDLMSQPQQPPVKRPIRESWWIEIAIVSMAIVLLVMLLWLGSWIWAWASAGAKPKADGDQDPMVVQYRRAGLELGQNAEGQIQVITTPQPLLVTDEDLKLVTGLQHLEVLDLRGTQISDEALFHLTDLPKLTQLYLGGALITDSEQALFRARYTDRATEPIQDLISLKVLSLARTDIGDQGIRRLVELKDLEALFLIDTQITDASLEPLTRMTWLKKLYVQETGITVEGAQRLIQALPKTEVHVSVDVDSLSIETEN